MAQERAAEQDVSAEMLCLEGEVREELKKAAREEGVSLVVLGRPVSSESTFQLADLEAFAAEVTDETGVETRII
jgi:hypothetical protein